MKKTKKKLKKKFKVFLIIFVITLLLVICYFLYSYLFVCKFEFIGEEYTSVEFNSEYVDMGAKITYRGKNVDYTFSTNLDTSKLGNYEYVYKYSIGEKSYSKKRILKVVDTVKPEIVLKGETDVIIDYTHEYKEEGFSASDNYDGDLTDKVTYENENVSDKDYRIKYSVKDSSNNEFVVYRNIIHKDLIALK